MSDKLDTIGVFGRSVKDVALLAKSLIRKDLYDASTIYFSSDRMLDVCEEKLEFDPKFIFIRLRIGKI